MPHPLRNKTAIAGIGWSRFSRASGTTALSLAVEASRRAIEDAGLAPRDIDGLVSFYWGQQDTPDPYELGRALGITYSNYDCFSQLGGNWSCGAVATAAMAVHAGLCRHVLVYRALNGRSGPPNHGPRSDASGPDQFTVPYGALHAASVYGHIATAHMARFGTTSLDFAHVAVTQRRHARLNTKAVMQKPLTIEDHQNSPYIVYPFRLLDCCIQTDGGAALIVTSAERARDLRQAPVHIMAASAGRMPSDHLWETNGVKAAPQLYAAAGIGPSDVSLAELYDPFTFMCLTHMEDFGLVPKGEAAAFVRAGKSGLDGSVPVNTHGGLLSEVYLNGLNHVVEAVQQLRPGGVVDDLCQGPHTYDRACCRQVRDPEVALVCGEEGGSALLLERA